MVSNIAFFHEYFPKGGAERVTADICEYLIDKGYNIYLFTREYNENKLPSTSSFKNKANILLLPDNIDSNSNSNALFIAEKSKELNIQILIVQAYVLQSIKNIKKKNDKLKIIYCNHGMPFWEIRDKIERKKEKAKRSILKRIQYYLFDIHKIYTFKTYHKRFLKAYKKLYEEVDAYVTLCDNYSKQIANYLNLKNTNKLYAINNAEKPVKNIVLNKQNIVLFVGRLSYADKRVDRLINIWNLLGEKTKDWKLVIVGDGPEKTNLENQAKALNLKNIEFTGYSTNTKKYYDIASVLCMTSSFEGWPLALTESQANGVIPIAFGCSEGVKAIMEPNGVNGLIITPFNLNEYAKSLEHLLSDYSYRKTLQKNIINKSKEYSPENIGRKWIELFNKLV